MFVSMYCTKSKHERIFHIYLFFKSLFMRYHVALVQFRPRDSKIHAFLRKLYRVNNYDFTVYKKSLHKPRTVRICKMTRVFKMFKWLLKQKYHITHIFNINTCFSLCASLFWHRDKTMTQWEEIALNQISKKRGEYPHHSKAIAPHP